MAVDVIWFDDQCTVAHFIMRGAWTWTEYEAARAQIRQMQEPCDNLVDHIYDMRQMTQLPPKALPNFSEAARSRHANSSGLVVFVGGGMLVRQLGSVFRRLAPPSAIELHFVETLEQAEARLLEQRPAHRARLRGDAASGSS